MLRLLASVECSKKSNFQSNSVLFSFNNIFFSFFAEENYDAFCLAYMFTYRDFEGGTLGLAWTGDMKNAGGVCERNGVRIFFLVYYNNTGYST